MYRYYAINWNAIRHAGHSRSDATREANENKFTANCENHHQASPPPNQHAVEVYDAAAARFVLD